MAGGGEGRGGERSLLKGQVPLTDESCEKIITKNIDGSSTFVLCDKNTKISSKCTDVIERLISDEGGKGLSHPCPRPSSSDLSVHYKNTHQIPISYSVLTCIQELNTRIIFF